MGMLSAITLLKLRHGNFCVIVLNSVILKYRFMTLNKVINEEGIKVSGIRCKEKKWSL